MTGIKGGSAKTAMFDVDGTLIDQNGHPRTSIVTLYKRKQAEGYKVGIWSRRGEWYARKIMAQLGLSGSIHKKGSFVPDEAVDNEEKLGKKNTMV